MTRVPWGERLGTWEGWRVTRQRSAPPRAGQWGILGSQLRARPPPRASCPRTAPPGQGARLSLSQLRRCLPGRARGRAGRRGGARRGRAVAACPFQGPQRSAAAVRVQGSGATAPADTPALPGPPPTVGVGQRPKSCLTGWAGEAQERNFSLLARSWSSSPLLPFRWHLRLRPGARSGLTLWTREEGRARCVHWGSVFPRPPCCQ